MDGKKGYMPQHVWKALLLNNNTREEAILARYNAMIHYLLEISSSRGPRPR